MKIYISGYITGHEEDAGERFEQAEKEIMKIYGENVEIINPYAVGVAFSRRAKPEHEDYMKISFALMDYCEAVYFLDGWQNSKGCKLEKKYAETKGMKILKI